MRRLRPGHAAPLGATWSRDATNFAVYSSHATAVELCLFSEARDAPPSERIPLASGDANVWHVAVEGIEPGQLYGYRVDGPFAPARGHRFNPAKLLLDPYARALSGPIEWRPELASHPDVSDGGVHETSADPRESAGAMPKGIVVDPTYDWGDDRRLEIPWDRTVIYECHVKGMTMLHPEVPSELRGSYLGLCSDPILAHLRSLHVTAVELLPIHQEASEPRLHRLGLVNYWGYSPIGYFAPDVRFATAAGRQIDEFRTMVRRFHAAGIEVLLDVVYNHTAEGGAAGPTLAFRGIDNAAYYRLDPERPERYVDFTGCGNTLDLRAGPALDLAVDSLRYWVEEMHVDGFRFDIAPVLGRRDPDFDPVAPFFQRVRADPRLAGVKLIAEPWDLGPHGYQVGAFPPGWAEWNGKWRDAVRRFWRGDTGTVGELASRLAGSSDLYAAGDRGPLASVNFVTCHDGFTLHDLVSYERKHNEANGEQNHDGSDYNLSRNWGVEGAAASRRSRGSASGSSGASSRPSRSRRASRMLSHGDETGSDPGGNNNAYCHDCPLTWLWWDIDETQRGAARVHPHGLRAPRGDAGAAPAAFLPAGSPRRRGPDLAARRRRADAEADWAHEANHALGMLFDGGEPLLVLLNGGGRSRPFALPTAATPWEVLLDTAHDVAAVTDTTVTIAPHSLVLLRRG